MNLPNKLTVVRMVLVPAMILVYCLNFPGHFIAACAAFVIASMTDILDGAIARKQGIVTKFGKLMDPMADKMLVCSALILLCSSGTLHPVVAIVIVVREFAVSALRMVAASEGVVLAADRIGKSKTLFQSIGVGFLLLSMDGLVESFGNILWWIGTVTILIGAVLALISCVNYFVVNKAVFRDME